MNTSAHFICRKALGITKLDGNVYTSEAWSISVDEAEKLRGGSVFFHETKSSPAYFGGVVEDYCIVTIDAPQPERIKFTIRATRESKGVKWSGRDYDLAWYSGLNHHSGVT